MALSGTLDTVALPDVLRLLASTAKTGRLRISAPGGSGSVWVDDGALVSTELAPTGPLPRTDAEVLFGLLRFHEGSFTFEAGAALADPAPGMAMEPILGEAERLLSEWRSIEMVVPSLDVEVSLRSELDGGEVTIDAERWRCLAAIGGGVAVRDIAATMERNEVDTCRLVKELVELGMLEIRSPHVGTAAFDEIVGELDDLAATTAGAWTGPEMTDVDIPETNDFEPVGDAAVEEHSSATDSASVDPMPVDLQSSPFAESIATDDGVDGTITSLAGGEADVLVAIESAPSTDDGPGRESADDLSADEIARHLANLSPRAAKAVAVAARATSEVERDAALAAVEAEDASVDRGLLLRFLGSVDS